LKLFECNVGLLQIGWLTVPNAKSSSSEWAVTKTCCFTAQGTCWCPTHARSDRRAVQLAPSDRHELTVFCQVRRREVVRCLLQQHGDVPRYRHSWLNLGSICFWIMEVWKPKTANTTGATKHAPLFTIACNWAVWHWQQAYCSVELFIMMSLHWAINK